MQTRASKVNPIERAQPPRRLIASPLFRDLGVHDHLEELPPAIVQAHFPVAGDLLPRHSPSVTVPHRGAGDVVRLALDRDLGPPDARHPPLDAQEAGSVPRGRGSRRIVDIPGTLEMSQYRPDRSMQTACPKKINPLITPASLFQRHRS